MTTSRRCLRLALVLPAILAMPLALAVTNHPPHRLKLATMASPYASPPMWAEVAPVPHPEAVTARQASEARDMALTAQWGEARDANQAAHEAAVAADALKADADAKQSRHDHEAQSPRLGGSSGGGSVDVSGAWACILNAESSGNWAEKSNPTYRGGLQMGYDEWAAMGGTGDPADASPSEQMMRGQMLQSQRGWQPWSTAGGCGLR